MSDSDGFIHEVTEELRRDRMLKLWRTFAPAVIGGVVAIVAATAIMEWHKVQNRAAAEEAGAMLWSAAQAGDDGARAAKFAAAAGALSDGPALVARLSEASAAAQGGDKAAAEAALAAVADAPGASPLYRDLAGFRAVLLALPGLSPEARADAVGPYLADGAPFRLLALEQRAMARLEAGNIEGARTDVDAALSDPMASAELRRRLTFLMELLGEGKDA
ncbi:MAG: hypothetical protein ACI9ZH_000259 [Paracoccaceae bacterium]|jgi:hypothetical protein